MNVAQYLPVPYGRTIMSVKIIHVHVGEKPKKFPPPAGNLKLCKEATPPPQKRTGRPLLTGGGGSNDRDQCKWNCERGRESEEERNRESERAEGREAGKTRHIKKERKGGRRKRKQKKRKTKG